MEKQKKKYAKCPCCLNEVHKTEMDICLNIQEKRDRKTYKNYKELNIDSYSAFIDCEFEWACDSCLMAKKAILTNPELQSYKWEPHLAYYDKQIDCNTCDESFVFTMKEKQVWYEQYKIRVDFEPVNCFKCRREIRLLKGENKILSDLLQKNENEISIDELKTISDIYRKWNKEEKAKFYQSIVKKRVKNE